MSGSTFGEAMPFGESKGQDKELVLVSVSPTKWLGSSLWRCDWLACAALSWFVIQRPFFLEIDGSNRLSWRSVDLICKSLSFSKWRIVTKWELQNQSCLFSTSLFPSSWPSLALISQSLYSTSFCLISLELRLGSPPFGLREFLFFSICIGAQGEFNGLLVSPGLATTSITGSSSNISSNGEAMEEWTPWQGLSDRNALEPKLGAV